MNRLEVDFTNPEYLEHLRRVLVPATLDTLYMVGFSSLLAITIGTLLGTIIYTTARDGLLERFVAREGAGLAALRVVNGVLGFVVNIFRSLPFIVVVFAVFPLARIIVGSSIGTQAAVVPLTIAAIPFVARLTEATFSDMPKGVLEAAISSGATVSQTFFRVIIPETSQGLVMNCTITIINLVGLSALSGLIGGGGLGDAAKRFGFDRHQTDILIYTIIILVILVQIVQFTGDYIAKRLDKR
ncbi:MAG: ABC transporter permease [Defluviitaleaceae bacterium]|nr:ABC transporter permease [Defluviitaleaceae bacterium]